MSADVFAGSTETELTAAAAAAVRRRAARVPALGLILGSGLGSLADRIDADASIPFAEVPGLAAPTVAGHAGLLVVGRLGDTPVAALRGRLHAYEGHPIARVVFPVRLLRALGCGTLVATNAAGGLNPNYAAGDLMAIEDHIYLPGLVGHSPLAGWAGPAEERFVDMGRAYDPALLALAERVARENGQPLRRGIYAMVAGPSYETPAEQRLLRLLGADAVGMSTAPEVVVARQLGVRVLGVSLIANTAHGAADASVSHADVLEQGRRAAERLAALIGGIVRAIGEVSR